MDLILSFELFSKFYSVVQESNRLSFIWLRVYFPKRKKKIWKKHNYIRYEVLLYLIFFKDKILKSIVLWRRETDIGIIDHFWFRKS